MNRIRIITAKVVLACSLVFSFVTTPPAILTASVALVATQTACPSNSNRVREARKAAYRIQVIVNAATDTTAELYEAKVLSREKTNQIARLLLKVNDANRVLIDTAGAATVDSPAVRSDLLETLKIIQVAVRELKDAGVLGIKSQNGELAFSSAMAALDTSIAIIQTALSGRSQ